MPATPFQHALGDYRLYLLYERSLSANTAAGYCSDISKLLAYAAQQGIETPEGVSPETLQGFLFSLVSDGISTRSQARTISSVKSFFKFLENAGRISASPCGQIDPPKMSRHLPSVLSVEEVERIIDSVDLSDPLGHRNKAILEMLYSCGLRVSELTGLRISDLFFGEGFIRVMGKGRKQRLVPVGETAVDAVDRYLSIRNSRPVARGCEDILFLNRRGGKMSRQMVFIIVEQQVALCGIEKEVSPHTFRHSFATHMIENGADLRAVQQMLGHESILTTEIYTHIDTRKWQQTIIKFHPLER